MRLRAILTAGAAVALTIGTMVVATPTASAAGGLSPICAYLNGRVEPNLKSWAMEGLSLNAGERLSVTASDTAEGASMTLSVSPDGFEASGPAPGTLSYTFATTGTFTVNIETSANTATFTLACGVPAVESAPIPMWVQAFARADKGVKCPEGWNPSWDQWPNNGKGGFVCQRSIKSFG